MPLSNNETNSIDEKEKLEDIETIIDPGREGFEIDESLEKEPILMAKIENVYHEPFQMTQEVKVCVVYIIILLDHDSAMIVS